MIIHSCHVFLCVCVCLILCEYFIYDINMSISKFQAGTSTLPVSLPLHFLSYVFFLYMLPPPLLLSNTFPPPSSFTFTCFTFFPFLFYTFPLSYFHVLFYSIFSFTSYLSNFYSFPTLSLFPFIYPFLASVSFQPVVYMQEKIKYLGRL